MCIRDSNKAEQMNVNPAELFIVLCCMNECHITDNAVKRLTVSDFDKVKTIFCKKNAAEFKLLKQTATGILYDMEYFPVPHSSKTEQWVNYCLLYTSKHFPQESETEEEDERPKVAIIGKPNVGKSSIINKLLGKNRVIVSNIAGTTRDAIDTTITYNKKEYVFIDTARCV